MLDDLQKCMDDPVYFAETHFKVVDGDNGLVPIKKLYDFQKDMVRALIKHRNVIACTGRQLGKTTIATIIILHHCLFEGDNKRVAVIANKEATAIEILERVKLAFSNLPDYIKGGVCKWGEKSLQFENGSTIIASASSNSNIRGRTVSMLYVDEMAHVEGWEEFSSSVLPTITSGKKTKIILTSTPCGYNHFHKYCMEAKRKENGFIYFEVPWWKIPGRDEKWKEATLKLLNNDEQKFAQEFECEFLGSVMTLISTAKLKAMLYDNPNDSMEFGNDKIKLYVKEIKEKGNYIILCDVSQGKGMDYSAFSVIDVSNQPYHQVATFRDNRIQPVEYAEVIYRTALKFNNAFILIELNDLGGQVADTLSVDLAYENIIHSESRGRSGQVACLFRDRAEPGIRTSAVTKAVGCNTLKSLIERDMLIIHDMTTLDELTTFVRSPKVKGSFIAAEGKNDDTITPLFLFGWLTTSFLFKDITNTDIRSQIRESAAKDIDDMSTPIVFVIGGFNSVDDNDMSGWIAVNNGTEDTYNMDRYRDYVQSR